MKKILVTGSVAYDVLLGYQGSFIAGINPSSLKNLSVSYTCGEYARHHGGTGANIAWNLALLRQSPLLVSTVGSDGGEYKALLTERGVSTTYVEQLQSHVTATAIIGTDDSQRQIVFFHPGADAHGSWPAEKLSDERDDIAYALVGARNPGLMMGGVHWCGKWKVPLLFDPGQLIIALSKEDLLAAIRVSKGLVCNAYEWSLLSEKTGLSTDGVLAQAEYLIVTHGGEGLTVYTRDGEHVLPACKADKIVNPTGAGDAFRAGVLAGLTGGKSLVDACKTGAALASFVVEQEGTLLDSLDTDELEARIKAAYEP